MSMNRTLVYQIRRHMPESRLLHSLLAQWTLRRFKKQLIPEKYVKQGEEDPAAVPEIVKIFKKKRPKQVKALRDGFAQYLEKAGMRFKKKEYRELEIKMLFDCLAYGFAPDEFIYYRLKDKSPEEKKAYVTDIERKMIQYIMGDFKDLQYVFDKAATYEKFGSYYKRDEISISGKADFEKFRAFAQKHDEMVIKLVSSSCGRGVTIEKTDRDNLKEQFDRLLSAGKCSIEERIVQSKITEVFNASSVNTLRLTTFNTKSGIHIGPCFFRTGRPGAYVDNGGSGGILAAVNRQTGVLDTEGCNEYLGRFEKHPASGIPYVGFQLPEWEACTAMAKEMAAMIPRVGYVAWDLAYTDRGWVLVEANGGGQFLTQICYERGCAEEIRGYIKDKKD